MIVVACTRNDVVVAAEAEDAIVLVLRPNVFVVVGAEDGRTVAEHLIDTGGS